MLVPGDDCALLGLLHACMHVCLILSLCVRRFVQKLQAATQLLETTNDVSRCRHIVALIADLARSIGELP